MPLPKIDTPVYEIELPISKKKIKFRPFLVKEQKNLLMAFEADDVDTINSSIKQVLNNCTIGEDLDIDELPIVDVEYYFLNLRAKSVGEVVEARYRCNVTQPDGQECKNIMEKEINILDVEVVHNENIKNIIQINSTIAVKMKYPQFDSIKKAAMTDDINDVALGMIADSIECIYDGEQVFYAKETTREELIEFVGSLNTTQFKNIEEFFDNLPKLNKKVHMKCSKCGFEHEIYFEGLESFFV